MSTKGKLPGKLYVSNMEQKILFFCELEGQLSDGYWENALPHDHWEAWMLKWDEIIVSNNYVGINFWPIKYNYNFVSSRLLEYVGDRMLTYIRFYRLYGERALKLLEKDHHLLPDNGESFEYWAAAEDRYGKEKMARIVSFGFSKEDIENVYKLPMGYGMKELRKDLKALKNACQSRDRETTPVFVR